MQAIELRLLGRVTVGRGDLGANIADDVVRKGLDRAALHERGAGRHRGRHGDGEQCQRPDVHPPEEAVPHMTPSPSRAGSPPHVRS